MINYEINAAIEDMVAANNSYVALQSQELALEADLDRVRTARAEAERKSRELQNGLLRLILSKEIVVDDN